MYFEPFTKEQLKTFYEELNITEESLERDVNYLIEWMEKQPHLPKVKDKILISHLLFQCKNSLEKTKKKLDAYYTMKALLPHLFINRDPTAEEFKNTYKISCPVPLPKMTPDGNRILIYRIFEPENSHLLIMKDFVKVNFTLYDIILKDDCTKKYILIYDFQAITISYANMMLEMIRKYLPCTQASYASRIHATHVVMRMNPTITTLFNMMKSLLTKKLADTLTLWNEKKPDFSTMYPAEIMPKEYGGTEKSIHELRDEFYEYVCGFREWLKSEDNYVADLSKRPDSSFEILTEEFVDGSFRQLSID